MYNTTIESSEVEYSDRIKLFVQSQFRVGYQGNRDVFDNVYAEIMGSNKIRYGSMPEPEDLVGIRQVIRNAIDTNRPIPMLTPWGSEKPDGSSIDVAELGALKTLSCLNDRVSAHYKPGIQANIRIENLTAVHLFDDKDKARNEALRYTNDLVGLISVLGLDTFIQPRPETSFATEDDLFKVVKPIEVAMIQYLKDTANSTEGYRAYDSYQDLVAMGWKGMVPLEAREFYFGQYFKMYKGITDCHSMVVLGRYLAAALVRHKLGLVGTDPEWKNEYIRLAFHTPVPGIPNGNTIYYRTVPSYLTNIHIQPWRAKGYLRIGEDKIKIGLASSSQVLDLVQNATTFTKDGVSVNVQSDYIRE